MQKRKARSPKRAESESRNRVNSTQARKERKSQPTTPDTTQGTHLGVDRPPPLRVEAFHGIAGEVIAAIEPESEADPAALLIQFLVTFGFLAGRNAYYQVEGDKHYPTISVVIVGATSRARKGTSWGRIAALFGGAPWWPRELVVHGGLSTGEGLISHSSHNVPEARLLIVEGEFSRTLRAMSRESNTLSQVLRNLWDGGKGNIVTKGDPVIVEGAHVSVIGHITEPELSSHLSQVDMLNGFANRFLWVAAHRSKELPFGGDLSDASLKPLLGRIRKALTFASKKRRINWAPGETRDRWESVYHQLAIPNGDALVDAVTGRAEAQICRIALIYALLDRSAEIRLEHLNAALAVWDYCNASARKFFGGKAGNATAEDIRSLLLREPSGVCRTAISKHFSGHRSRGAIDSALNELEKKGLARRESHQTKGRPAETWFALVSPPA